MNFQFHLMVADLSEYDCLYFGVSSVGLFFSYTLLDTAVWWLAFVASNLFAVHFFMY